MIRDFLKGFLIFLFLMSCSHAHLEQDIYFFQNNQENKRFYALGNEIRCIVCQNQSINESQAPLARDLRKKMYLMIKENKSDDEIKNYLVKRYGEFILFKPRFSQTTILLWLFPFLCLGGCVLQFYYLMRKQPF